MCDHHQFVQLFVNNHSTNGVWNKNESHIANSLTYRQINEEMDVVDCRTTDSSSNGSCTDNDEFHTAVSEQHGKELEYKVSVLKQTVRDQQLVIETQKQTIDRSMQLIKQLLLNKSEVEMKAVQEKSDRNRLRLGEFRMKRQGSRCDDKWVEGTAFQEIYLRQEQNNNEKERIERLRKSAGKHRQTPAKMNRYNQDNDDSSHDSASNSLPDMAYYDQAVQDEALKFRLSVIKKEDLELQQELEKLERERSIHAMELKTLSYQETSRFKNHQVLNGCYLILNIIGKGGFSEVHKCFDLKEQRYAACKVHQMNIDWSEERKASYLRHTLRECEIQKQLCHQHVVQLYDVFDIDADSFCTIIELCDGHDLEFHLKVYISLNEKEARSIIIQTVSALQYLNTLQNPIIHYDLKPGNILICNNGTAKITDFGLSKIMDNNYNPQLEMDLTSQGAGTYWYLPPECFIFGLTPPKVSSKVDVWSVGVIFYQCLYAQRPFGHSLCQGDILRQGTILNATNVEFPAKPTVSSDAKEFIKLCLTYDKDQRPDVITLAQHDFLNPSDSKAGKGRSRQSSNR